MSTLQREGSAEGRPHFTLKIDDQSFTITNPSPTGRELLALVERDPEDFFLVFLVPEEPDLVVELDEVFDLSRPGIEKLALVSRARRFSIQIDEATHSVVGPLISGSQILGLAGKDSDSHFVTQIIAFGDDVVIQPDDLVDISQAGKERFTTVARLPLTIEIDALSYQPGRSEMTGDELRLLPNPAIEGSRDLWLDVPGKDDRRIEGAESVRLKDGMVFYTAPSTINPGRKEEP